MIHPWRDLPSCKHPPEEAAADIQIPSGNRSKYGCDKDSGLLRLDRVLYEGAMAVIVDANQRYVDTHLKHSWS